MSFGLMTRDGALTAIQSHLDAARLAALTAARDAFLLEHGKSVEFPPDGPVLPTCRVDDPTDLDFEQGRGPNGEPRLIRRLAVMSGQARPGELLNADADEPTHQFDLEWMLIVPSELHAKHGPDFGPTILRRGLHEIEAVLAPMRQTGLPVSPEAPTIAAASAFDFGGLDVQSFDLGDHTAFAAYLSLDCWLDARSVLS
ncbi:hypothetical protein [Litorimonas sp. WD9-15]|uniref:hypothetical protein n=1 Tax=Litorimonas sp. WD9-15 TaxID=3418716 RepID=UPI003D047D2E